MSETKKFLIYKGSGGLFHNLSGLTYAINIAKNNNLILIIDMFSHIRKQNKPEMNFSDFFIIDDNENLNYYTNYNILPKDIRFKGLSYNEIININVNKMIGNTYYYNDINLSNPIINENENASSVNILCGYFGWNLNSNIKINNDIYNLLKKEENINEPYISIHFRNTDMKHNIKYFITRIKNLMNKTKINLLYLATDDYYAFDIIKKEIPSLNIIRKTFPDKDIHNLHYTSEDKKKQMYECIRDVYYILKSTYFIPSLRSAYSNACLKMIKEKKYIIPDFQSKTIIYT